MAKLNILKLLSRSDKWSLGNGGPLVWSPSSPLWLDRLGFWDKADWYDFGIHPVFTVTLLDESEKEIALNLKHRVWNPAWLEQRYDKLMGKPVRARGRGAGLQVKERKSILAEGEIVSEFRLKNSTPGKTLVHLLVWTIQENLSGAKGYITDIRADSTSIVFTKHLLREAGKSVSIRQSLSFDRVPDSLCIAITEHSPMIPSWHLTPFGEKFQDGRFLDGFHSVKEKEGFVHLALHSKLILKPRSEETICVTSTIELAEETAREKTDLKTQIQATSTSWKKTTLIQDLQSPISVSAKSWKDFFSLVPYFECSDDFLTRYYWYRWYGLQLFTVKTMGGNFKYAFVCEGSADFHRLISYSAQCHMMETRWLDSPEIAQGSLLNFIEHQKEDGSFYGAIGFDGYYEESFYHSNWGKATLEVDRVHRDELFLSRIYDGLRAYAEYFDRVRDRERSGLYDVINHFETGQEFMSRYMAVSPKADSENWGTVFRLKGVDATIYLYELKKALAEMAERLRKSEQERQGWLEGAAKIKEAVLRKMWDPGEEMFFDINPLTLKRTGVKAAVCFYPYMTDIVDESHLEGLKQHLFNKNQFWTPYPVPSTSADDPMFSAEGEWKGRRMNCPWNGRVWPMTNSHIAEGLAQSSIRFRDEMLREKAVQFISKFIRMMFFDGDPTQPNCFEHYHPYQGTPSVYRGIDDYQHSWVVDLIIKYVAGLRPEKDYIIVDPFPFELSSLLLENVVIRGLRLKIQRRGKRFSVFVNDEKVGDSILGEPIAVVF